MKTGDLAGPDRCLGTNSRTRPTSRTISDLPIEFRSSGRRFTQDLGGKISALRGDTNGSSLRWDISRHSSDLHRRLAGAPPDFAPLLTGLLGCDGDHEEPANTLRQRSAHRIGRARHLPERREWLLRPAGQGHGQRELVTLVGHAAANSSGEWITASGYYP